MNLIKSPLSALLNQAGIPTLANGGTPPSTPAKAISKALSSPMPIKQAMAQLQQQLQQAPSTYQAIRFSPASSMPSKFLPYGSDPFAYLEGDNMIDAYRANPKNKFGAKDFIETQPTRLNSDQITAYMRALRDAAHLGVKPLTPEQLATMALLEGRSDLGYNMFNYNNPKAVKLAETLSDYMGHDPQAAGFAAAVLDKQMQSQRTGIPFTTLWNGTGRGAAGTGEDYTKRYKAAYNTGAYEHPKNAVLYEAIATGLMPEKEKPTMPQVDPMGNPTGYKTGGPVSKEKAFLKFKKK